MKLTAIKNLFELSYGNKLDLNKMDIARNSDEKTINFVARTSKNLGVSAFVQKLPDIEPYEKGLITVALGGAILASFVQQKDFYTAQNIMILKPKREMTFQEKVYYCLCIEKNKNRYSTFGREANRTLKDILIPEKPPNWISEVNEISPQEFSKPLLNHQLKLDIAIWKWFTYDELFEIERGRGPRIKELTGKGNVPFVTSTDQNNGLTGFTDEKPKHNGNVISVNRNGSVGEAFYQPVSFCSTEDVHIFNSKFELNPYIAMFLITLIRKEKYRFGYGRKWGIARMKETKIKLPVDANSKPDWKFMEDYIKSLPYSANL